MLVASLYVGMIIQDFMRLKSISDKDPSGYQSVFESNLLALFGPSGMITYGDFHNFDLIASQFTYYFGTEFKTGAGKIKRA